MEEENAVALLQRYRRDRRVLLNFLLSGNLIKKVVMPPGAISLDDVDLDQVSVDHVLSCAKKGEMLELSEAIRDYHDSAEFPTTSNTGSADEFFLVTETSGSPPRRAPPPLPVSTPSLILPSSELALSLSSFETGITDDDLRETAYEILLASNGAAAGLIVPPREKKKEKSKFTRMFSQSRRDHPMSQSHTQPSSVLTGLLETMRVQMEISEEMDIRTRQGLLNALVGNVGKRLDTLLVPLELLSCVSHTEFSDKKTYLRWQKRQLNMLEEGLINHPALGFGGSRRKPSELKILLRKIEESESLPPASGELQRTECLRSLREITVPLAERPVRGDPTGEICHWADGYHLNVKLYEKLLFSVFYSLDEGKLTEEVEEIHELIKSTWKILRITETIHYTCYAWVLFRQFEVTSEQEILRHAIQQLKKIPLKEQRGQQERLHLKSLSSKVETEDGSLELTFLQSFLTPIQRWANKQLGDYHLHFAEGSAALEEIVTVSMVARRLLLEEPEARQAAVVTDEDQIESYITSTIKIAFAGIVQAAETISDSRHEHPLALLAEDARKLLKKDSTLYLPILSKWDSRATAVSAALIHRLYGHKLKPFLESVEHLTEDAVSVFPAADSLEQYVLALITSSCEEEIVDEYCKRKLIPYQVESISGTLVLRWLNSELGRMLALVERASQQEHWDPISRQQRHGSSIVEVFRIVEKTVDQFFVLKVPMRPGELNSLFRGIDNAFQVYTTHVTDNLVSKEDLIRPAPILTRFRKDVGIKAPADAKISSKINVLTTPKLCVMLNTLHFAISQLNKLGDHIREQWAKKRPRENFKNKKSALHKDPFNGSRKDINAAIYRICEFTGTKVIFWDMRESFIEKLYKPNVRQSRLEVLIDPLDAVSNELCAIIVEPLRDHIVTGLLQASVEGLIRVLVDEGPSRTFSPADAKFLEEDLEILKEFFIVGGNGLPRGTVENEVASVKSVIRLHGLSETRVLIDDLKSASNLEI